MKKWLVFLLVTLVVSGCQDAGKVDQQDVEKIGSADEEKHSEHAAEFGWLTDFEKAAAKAKAEGKHMLLDFSGSDWCGWCIKLDDEVFSKEEFKAYAKDNLVMVLADFPRDKSKQSAAVQKQNDALAKTYGVQGFPTVYILDSSAKPVAKTGYQAGGPEAYVEHVKKLIADSK